MNLKPNKEGEIEVKNVDFDKYSNVQILIGDQKSVLSMRKFNVSSKESAIEKKDLRLKDTLDSNKFYNEVRNSFALTVGSAAFEISDISSA